MIKSFFTSLKSNYKGWSTNRKIVVIESDDWGGIRMPSKEVFNKLINKNIKVEKCPYNTFDNLANKNDLNPLFELIASFRDFKGNHPIITTNFNLVNPDFEKIKESGFQKYYYEPFSETLNRYFPNENTLEIWKEGIKNKLVYPQYHGREHVNVDLWLKLLKSGNKSILTAFENNVYGLSFITSNEILIPYLATLIYEDRISFENVKNNLIMGNQLFQETFGFNSESFIAPVYSWSNEIESVLNDIGVKYLQGGNYKKNYNFNTGSNINDQKFLGEKNKFNQYYLIRNCSFEPTINGKNNIVENCMQNIQNAFIMNKPAILSAHRLNFIGSLNENNRIQNLELFNVLLKNILKKWPNVEFLSSVELGNIIANE